MQPLYTRHGNRYRAAANAEILDAAAAIIVTQTRGAMLSSPQEAERLCRSMCAGYDNERFGVVWLDSRHRVIHAETLCAFRPMTDTIPNRWRTPFRRHGGQRSDRMADTLTAGSEACPP